MVARHASTLECRQSLQMKLLFSWQLIWGILPSRDLLFESFNFGSLSYLPCVKVGYPEHLVFECPFRIAWFWQPWITRFNLFNPRSDEILFAYHLLI
uniref:Uncharacterized protein n=1 Tax=Fagus sylvatica TaxID=28930 RepID=A0A2N9ESD5_FAGSY